MKNLMSYLTLVAIACVLLTGCKPASQEGVSSSDVDSASGADGPIVMDEMPPVLDDVHAHPTHGPHGGDLVELGKEEFHAEIVHDAGGTVMYVLDASATKPVSIRTEQVVISLKHQGEVASFDVAGDPDADDPPGQTSRCTSADQRLAQWLDAGAEGAIVIQIEGKSYTGKVVHDHGHAGHSH